MTFSVFGDRQGQARPLSIASEPRALDSVSEMYEYISATGSDKGYHHHYERYYAPIMHESRDLRVRLLEIGVERGASMALWENYFPAGTIYGIGYHNFQTKDKESSGRTTLYMGDQSNIPWLTWMAKDSGGKFDYIIDDGSHLPEHQRTSLNVLWPHVVPGGYYIIEDIETSYWKSGSDIYGYIISGKNNFVEWAKAQVDITVNREFSRGDAGMYGNVESIQFGQNIIVLRKALDTSVLSRPYRFQASV